MTPQEFFSEEILALETAYLTVIKNIELINIINNLESFL